MNKYRSLLLMVLIIISANAYCQNCSLKDSAFCNLKMNKIKELSFRMHYFTRPKVWDYGHVYLEGSLKKGEFRVYLFDQKSSPKTEYG